MGRQGPRLVPFLQNGFINKMYRNLIAEDSSGLIFSIVLPHKSKKLDREDELIFSDWYALNGKEYVFGSKHYTNAKQAMTASLRKSEYVEKVHVSENKLTYRILSDAEVKAKKRLAKELKKLVKETCGSDDALSSGESGYGSAAGSPSPNYGGEVQDNPTSPSGNSSPLFKAMEDNTLFGKNELPQIACSSNFDGFLKTAPMDTSISAENYPVFPDITTSFDPDVFTNLQPILDYLESKGDFSESNEHPTKGLDRIKSSSEAPGLFSSGFEAPQLSENGNVSPFDDISMEDLYNIFKDVPGFDLNSMFSENRINPAAETLKGPELCIKSEDIFADKWNDLKEDFTAIDSHPSPALEEKNHELNPSPDAVVAHETEENIYLCEKSVPLGETLILLCEPQFEKKSTKVLGEKNSSEELGLPKIVFDEAIRKEIIGFKFKDYKIVNDHLMVILKPNDE